MSALLPRCSPAVSFGRARPAQISSGQERAGLSHSSEGGRTRHKLAARARAMECRREEEVCGGEEDSLEVGRRGPSPNPAVGLAAETWMVPPLRR